MENSIDILEAEPSTEATPDQISSSEPKPSLGSNHKDLFKAWWQASRPPFFIATLAPLFLGFVAAGRLDSQWRPGMFVLILLASFLVHLATNLANDLYDYLQGVDSDQTIGGSRVIQDGKIKPSQIKLALVFCYTIAFLLALIIVGHNITLWVMVIFAALSSFFYVAPPIKYGHRGLGELFVFLNMGLIMGVGTYIALTDTFNTIIVSLSLPVAFMVANILYYQSLPEIVTDLEANKKTLANILGKEGAALVYLLWWPLIWLLLLNIYFSKLAAWPVLLGLLTIPLHISTYRRIKKASDWLELDCHGHLVRKLYILNSLALIIGVAVN